MAKKTHNGYKKLAVGATIAAAAGYVAGILTAPKSGKETRKDIKQTTEKGIQEAEKEFSKVHTELDSLIAQAKVEVEKLGGKAKTELEELLLKARGSKAQAQDSLQSLKRGTVDDKEFKKAVADATKAVEHLKKYLSK